MKNLKIYRASAGSGKTHALVKEYLKLIFNNPADFRHTLAVTFTNKAAGEMKERIIGNLADLSVGNNESLKKQLIDEGIEVNIEYLSEALLSEILHKYSFFSVSTIDSFFHKVIRSFSRELNLQLGYGIEMDADDVMSEVVDSLIEEVGDNKYLTSYLEDFIYFNMDEYGGWDIEKNIKKIGMEVFRETYWVRRLQHGSDITDDIKKVKQFIDDIFEIINEFDNDMMNKALKAEIVLNNYAYSITDFHYGKTGFMNWLLNRIRLKEYEIKPRVQEVIDNSVLWYKKINEKDKNFSSMVENELKPLFNETIQHIDDNIKKYTTAKVLTKTIYVIGIFGELLNKLKAYRDENKTILISDFNNLLKTIISDDISPFVYEKIGNNFKHFLIDEFQDTSTFQWNNFLPLLVNSLSENNEVFIVGDVKQSIYRFRNGNMMLLLNDIFQDLYGYKTVMDVISLKENWRSAPAIVNFNNAFFAGALNLLIDKLHEEYPKELIDIFTKTYEDINQEVIKSQPEGYVNISIYRNDDETDETKYDKINSRMLEIIKELQNDKFPLKDILVLVEKNDQCYQISQLLGQNDIKTISTESILISSSPKIKLIINLLKYIVNNRDSEAAVNAVFNYLVYCSENKKLPEQILDKEIEDIKKLFQDSMPEGFFKESIKSGKRNINPLFNSLSLYETIENILQLFNLCLSGNSLDPYVLGFQDIILDYVRKKTGDIASFLEWWEENSEKYSITVPSDIDAVRVMTIHKAKGLQSPVVILPYTNWNLEISAAKDFIWVSSDEPPFNSSSAFYVIPVKELNDSNFSDDFNKEKMLKLIDRFNMLYVGLTRPVERLYVMIPDKSNKENSLNNAGTLIKETLKSFTEFDSEQNPFVYESGKKESKTLTLEAKKKELSGFKVSLNAEDVRDSQGIKGINKLVVLPKYKSLKLVKDKDFSDKTNWGNLVHEALSRIDNKSEIEKVISTLESEGWVNDNNKNKLLELLNNIFKNKTVCDWFSGNWDVRSESEIIMPGGELKRPDRVLIKDNKAVVIDYKTGNPKDEHHKQVNDYADILKQQGYEQVDKFIYYFQDDNIVSVN